jgi:hypothetical protein
LNDFEALKTFSEKWRLLIKSVMLKLRGFLKIFSDEWRCYAGHMIRRPEDLPQKGLFRAKPIIKEDQNPGGRMG